MADWVDRRLWVTSCLSELLLLERTAKPFRAGCYAVSIIPVTFSRI